MQQVPGGGKRRKTRKGRKGKKTRKGRKQEKEEINIIKNKYSIYILFY
jgi:hypothetical protein